MTEKRSGHGRRRVALELTLSSLESEREQQQHKPSMNHAHSYIFSLIHVLPARSR